MGPGFRRGDNGEVAVAGEIRPLKLAHLGFRRGNTPSGTAIQLLPILPYACFSSAASDSGCAAAAAASASPSARSARTCRARAASRSAGGRSTKIHALVDRKGRPLHFVVTGGQVHDNQVVGELLHAPQPALAVTADKAYDSKSARQQIKDDGAVPVIPSRCNAVNKARCPKRVYRQRHKIETSSAASRTGGASPPASTSSLATSSPPPVSLLPFSGSRYESRP